MLYSTVQYNTVHCWQLKSILADEAALHLRHSWSVWGRSAELTGCVRDALWSALFPSPPSESAFPNQTESTHKHIHSNSLQYTHVDKQHFRTGALRIHGMRVTSIITSVWMMVIESVKLMVQSYLTDLAEMFFLQLLSFQGLFFFIFSGSSPSFRTYGCHTQSKRWYNTHIHTHSRTHAHTHLSGGCHAAHVLVKYSRMKCFINSSILETDRQTDRYGCFVWLLEQ